MVQGKVFLVCPNIREIEFHRRSHLPNLGLLYLAAMLREHGIACEVLDGYLLDMPISRMADFLRKEPLTILGIHVGAQKLYGPAMNLLKQLRKRKEEFHTTLGGQFASLADEEILKASDGLVDSIVRGEGEYTLLILSQSILHGNLWQGIPGISYLDKGKVIRNPTHPLIIDLDTLPFPARDMYYNTQSLPQYISYHAGLQVGNKDLRDCGHWSVSVLTSRGCRNNCGFCTVPLIDSMYELMEYVIDNKKAKLEEDLRFFEDYMEKVFSSLQTTIRNWCQKEGIL